MSVTDSDLKLFKSVVISDVNANGGKETTTEIVSAVLNNMFPNVTNPERTLGITRYRKAFLRNINALDEKFENTRFWIDFLSTAADYFRVALGTYQDTQLDVLTYDGGELWSGSLTGGAVAVGDFVTGVISLATGKVLVITGGTIKILVYTGTFQAERVEVTTNDHFTTTGTGTFSNGFLGTGRITGAISAGGNSMDINFFDTDIEGRVHIGDKLLITDKENVGDTGHSIEEVEIATISWAGTIATITTSTTFQNSYAISYVGTGGVTFYTRVAVPLVIGNLVPSISNIVKTLPTGDYVNTSIVAKAQGSVQDNITLTFTSATAFDVTGTNVASYGSGNTSTDFNPTNPNTSTPYFNLSFSGWSGTFATNDTLTFTVNPPSQGIWIKEVVPAATPSFALNKTWVACKGDSAIITTTTTTTTSTTTTSTSTTTTTTT